MEFGGFPFPDSAPSYPTGPCFYKYLKSFVKHFDLMPNIQVSRYVILMTILVGAHDKYLQNTNSCI